MISQPVRRRHRTLLLLVLLLMGAFAYLTFAAVAQFFFGNAGLFAVTIIVVALIIPPYLREHRHRKRARARKALYWPRPEKVPGEARLEAEVLASFILGGSALILVAVGSAARMTPVDANYSNLPLWLAGWVLSAVGQAVIAAWFWSTWSSYDPYDPYAPMPPLFPE
jgi:hypothetical protein